MCVRENVTSSHTIPWSSLHVRILAEILLNQRDEDCRGKMVDKQTRGAQISEIKELVNVSV